MKERGTFFFVLVFVSLALVLLLAQPAKAETLQGIIHKNGILPGNETWIEGNVYWVDGDLTIPVGVTLTVQPGVIVKVAGSKRIFVNGTLTALGNAQKQIYFTSIKDDLIGGDTNGDGSATLPAKEDWGWLEFGATSSASFDYATLRYSGWSGGYGDVHGVFFASSYNIPNVGPNVTLTNNWGNGIEIPGGNLAATSYTFPYYSAAAYLLTGTLTIPEGASLTVDPGAIIKVGYYDRIVVNGTMSAQGTADRRIFFTSIKDDLIGGDTNGDGSATLPAKEDWGWLEFGATSSASFDYATLRYSGWSGGNRGAFFVKGGNVLITNSTLTNNFIGLEADVAGYTQIHNSEIYGNQSYGIKNNQLGVWLDATNNWWGHITGPKDLSADDGISNALGLGDPVSDYVTYSPWFYGSVLSKYVYLPLVRK